MTAWREGQDPDSRFTHPGGASLVDIQERLSLLTPGVDSQVLRVLWLLYQRDCHPLGAEVYWMLLELEIENPVHPIHNSSTHACM